LLLVLVVRVPNDASTVAVSISESQTIGTCDPMQFLATSTIVILQSPIGVGDLFGNVLAFFEVNTLPSANETIDIFERLWEERAH
jgi:hypothetical protein